MEAREMIGRCGGWPVSLELSVYFGNGGTRYCQIRNRMIQRKAAKARYFLRFCRLTLEGVEIGPRHKLNNRAIKMVITAKAVKTLADEPVKLRCSIAWNVASPTSSKARQITKRYRCLSIKDGIRGRR